MTDLSVEHIPLRASFEYSSDRRLLERNHDEWDDLRQSTPVFRSDLREGMTHWYVLRYEDVHYACQHPDPFSSVMIDHKGTVGDHHWIPEELDPPEHTKFRQLLNPLFSPGKVEAMEAQIRAQCVTLIEPLVAKRGCDLIGDFSRHFPTTIFMRLMGLPVEEADKLLRWVQDLMHTIPSEDPDWAVRGAAANSIMGYLDALLAARRVDPRDDIVSYLLTCRVDDRPLTDDELREMCFLLYMAGLDTVAGMLGYIFRHLADHPSHRQLLLQQPLLVAGFVEECLRYYSLVTTGRYIRRDVEFAGCPMRAGDRIILPIPAANRDPEGFANASEFVIDRSPNRHMAFGAGPHRCLGSHLARLELQIAVEEWLPRIPEFRIAPGAELTQHLAGVAGYDALPLTWE